MFVVIAIGVFGYVVYQLSREEALTARPAAPREQARETAQY